MHLKCPNFENKAISSLICNWLVIFEINVRTEPHLKKKIIQIHDITKMTTESLLEAFGLFWIEDLI